MANLKQDGYSAEERLPMLEKDEEQGVQLPIDGGASRKLNYKWTFILVVLNCTMFLVTFADVAFRTFRSNNPSTDGYATDLNPLLKQTSYYSPLLDRVSVPLKTKSINDTLYNRSVYAQPPGLQVDEAWKQLTRLGLTYITAADVTHIGKDPSLTVHAPDNPDAHLMMPLVTHQLHCLNGIRKNLFREYYYPDASMLSPLHEDHLLHCLDVVREALQCAAPTELITYNWMRDVDIPQPDFTYNAVCRDWDGLKGWMDANEVDPMRTIAVWRREGGEREVDEPWQWTRIREEQERQREAMME
ncbi:hypothetical protein NA57DRAFT_74908 [Rhizodiscina lignyota]|uniref:Tat pathway signal sequence n=1 Tax=Rhizodiscina lignyota TaxID=1504668 RepID=A0A9P4IG57_9PEZI|nr:hypothetical protein NA57DRAFT_74908 [Rhizodiscina lignyota]